MALAVTVPLLSIVMLPLALMPSDIARGVNVARALDGEIAPGIDGIVLGARGVDSASAVDVDVADGSDGVTQKMSR